MPARRLPVRPDLEQLKHQAKDLLKAYRDRRRGSGRADFAEFHPEQRRTPAAPSSPTHSSCSRGATTRRAGRASCSAASSIDAIWDDDPDTVRRLVTANRQLLTEDAGIGNENWGPPLSYAANLGRDRIIRLLYDLGARDLEYALGRAVLQSRVDTAALLHEMLGRPDAAGGRVGRRGVHAERAGHGVSVSAGRARATRAPARPSRRSSDPTAAGPPTSAGFSRSTPNTATSIPTRPIMAFHRGRFDLLEQHLARDPGLLARTFADRRDLPA